MLRNRSSAARCTIYRGQIKRVALSLLIVVAGCSQSAVPSTRAESLPTVRTGAGSAYGYKVLHFFGYLAHGVDDGASPAAALVESNGKWYGTTTGGGQSGGAIYTVSPSGDVHVLTGFPGSFDPRALDAPLTPVGATLYGTSSSGGANSYTGTVFSFARGRLHVLHSFGAGNGDGNNPHSGLVSVNGVLYGTTTTGGTSGVGTFFSITPRGTERILYSFAGGNDGKYPYSTPIYFNGSFYGTTLDGGPRNMGTIYKMSLDGAETILHVFTGGADSSYPQALSLYGNRFYGTTSGAGGKGDWGTAFTFTTGAPTVLYRFKGKPDGGYPVAGLLLFHGKLYGTTQYGGKYDKGTIFALSTSGVETKLHDFRESYEDGGLPGAPLVAMNATTLWGTTFFGGPYSNAGTIFEITP